MREDRVWWDIIVVELIENKLAVLYREETHYGDIEQRFGVEQEVDSRALK
jgi:hypothetical protein